MCNLGSRTLSSLDALRSLGVGVGSCALWRLGVGWCYCRASMLDGWSYVFWSLGVIVVVEYRCEVCLGAHWKTGVDIAVGGCFLVSNIAIYGFTV